jgi:hypothetical protein
VFIASGSRTDHGEVQSAGGAFPGIREVPLTSALFRLPADGDDVFLDNDANTLASSGILFADGLRNAFDPTFAPNGDLLSGDNGPDADYSEELNWLREGRHYGFPWRLGDQDNAQQFPDYDPSTDRRLQRGFTAVDRGSYANDPTFPRASSTFTDPIENRGPDADTFRDPTDGAIVDASDRGQSLSTLTAHRSPLGLSFDTEGALCGELYESGFLLSYGAAAGDIPDRGGDLLHLAFEKVGDRYTVAATKLVTGFAHPVDSVLVASKLYVLEHEGAGRVWEVQLPEP